MDMTDPRGTLLELAEKRGASLSALSRMLGKNPSYLQQFVRKGSPRKLEEGDRGKLARFFGVDESVLGRPKEISSKRLQDWVDVPRLAVDASAGGGAFAGEEELLGTIRFSPRWLRSMGLDPKALSAIAVAGDSMAPTLQDGDEILVDRTVRALSEGIHVLRHEGNLLVKRIERGPGGAVRLISDNKVYDPIECPAGSIDVIGRVVWKGGRL